MKWLCKIRHSWTREYNSTITRAMPSPYTFYERYLQPRYQRECRRCKKLEYSKQDIFGNIWWVDKEYVQYNR